MKIECYFKPEAGCQGFQPGRVYKLILSRDSGEKVAAWKNFLRADVAPDDENTDVKPAPMIFEKDEDFYSMFTPRTSDEDEIDFSEIETDEPAPPVRKKKEPFELAKDRISKIQAGEKLK